MKRIILGFSLVFCVFMISLLNAQANAVSYETDSAIWQNKMSSFQTEFLFGTNNLNNLNVEILSTQELKETQGEFWGNWFFKWMKFPPVPVCSICVLRK